MIQFLAKSTCASGTLGCRRTFPRHLLHRITTLAFLAGGALFSQLLYIQPLKAKSTDRPNIVLILADDLGWNHLSAQQVTMGTHSAIYSTPNIAKLATGGLSFTHAYAQPNCAPTRAAMLSGQYPARVYNDVYCVGSLNRYGKGVKNGISKKDARFLAPKQTEDVAAQAITVAEALKQNGYVTAHIGKYHVGGHKGDATLPENVGFDINLGGFSQGHQPTCFATKDKSGRWAFRGVGRGDFDRFGEPYADDYIRQRGLPAELVGTPKHISDALGDAMEETISKLVQQAKPFYFQFHSYAVHGPVKARPDLKKATQNRVGHQASNKIVEYAAFIASVDENLGRMLDAIDDPNGDGNTSDSIADNTLILFTSDNGGTHANNLPLRGEKGMFTGGGIRVPLIAYWKEVIAPNKVTDHMVHSVDYYPTFLELAGEKWMPPASEHPLDGQSFSNVLFNPGEKSKRDAVFYLFPGYMDSRAQPCVVVIDEIQSKHFKLFYFYEADSWELYCLSDDQGETNNLFKSQPEVASTLSKKIHAWLLKDHPTWNPKYPLDKNTRRPVGPPPTL